MTGHDPGLFETLQAEDVSDARNPAPLSLTFLTFSFGQVIQ